MVASGNDFIVLGFASSRVRELKDLAKKMCDRKYGIGADGLLVLKKTKVADVRMRVFNTDGSEAEMCGNGARCVALWFRSKMGARSSNLKIETRAGIIGAEVSGNNARIRLTEPKGIKLDVPIQANGRTLRVHFINTGVPHAVIFVEGLNKIDVAGLGRQIRYHKRFSPKGTNVDFVEILSEGSISLRTYERGVEDETLACGTGSVASALLYAMRYPLCAKPVLVHTKSKEILKVYFDRDGQNFRNVWLEGKTKIVYKGEYYV